MMACSHGDLKLVESILEKRLCLRLIKAGFLEAAGMGGIEIVKVLLKYGVDVNVASVDGDYTALHMAALVDMLTLRKYCSGAVLMRCIYKQTDSTSAASEGHVDVAKV